MYSYILPTSEFSFQHLDMKYGPLGLLLSYFQCVYEERPGRNIGCCVGARNKVTSKLKTFVIPTFKIRISSTLQMKVPVPRLTPRILPNPVRVPNLVVIMYNEIVLFCAPGKAYFLSIIITEVCHWFLNCLSKIKL